MDLSYEETVQRIRKYEIEEHARGTNHELCTSVQYLYLVHVYKGERNLLFVPLITSIGWTSTYMAWHKVLNESSSTSLIGKSVLEAFEHIKNGHVDARTRLERQEDNFIHISTNCNSNKSFNKKYFLCIVIYNEDGSLIVSKTHKLDGNKGYGGVDEGKIHLGLTATAEAIGEAVMSCFESMEKEYGGSTSNKRINRGVIDTLCGKEISFEIPDLVRYKDEADFHSGEVYQGYSYTRKGSSESNAKMFFSLGADIDGSIQKGVLLDRFAKYYEAANQIEFSELSNEFYDYYTEIVGDVYRQISFIKLIDTDELFCCELVIQTKGLRASTISKIINDFTCMAKSCNFV